MIKRIQFNRDYSVWHGMSYQDINTLHDKAKELAMQDLNDWRNLNSEVNILSITEKSFTSRNSDDSPFWYALTVLFEEKP
jgi:hypothetical protein